MLHILELLFTGAEVSLLSISSLLPVFLALTLPVAALLVGFFLSRLFTPRDYSKEKYDRFEAGNPPTGRARGYLAMQYYPYLVVFLTVEPVLIFIFLSIMSLHEYTLLVGSLFAILTIILALPLAFALDSARRLKLWIMRRD
ncbi:hypothetical protein AKJ40_02370 [candidate division MSBL1 archaeon SCGC-AAA259M10]|uniref:NADH dehydrogenase n=1 Tax=candidate division MSBL1 archaeon SCGC-AAA259M10 TaxID=1698270 RepID=A0A133V051_9EURY|nr:hypothetical protein AKJ40_02370 [candidate division MSBL1 archaeon SCGC-AAA259M10]